MRCGSLDRCMICAEADSRARVQKPSRTNSSLLMTDFGKNNELIRDHGIGEEKCRAK